MVMSQEGGEVGGKVSPVPREKEQARMVQVSDREKELAGEASTAFTKGDYTGCLNSLEKLEILRPTDCALAHNKIVTQCRAAGGQQVALSEVVQQLEGLAKTLGLNLTSPRSDDDVEGSVLVYNLAVAKFQQRHMLQAFQLASRLLPPSPSLSPAFARKILFLHCELSLALHQPELALEQAARLESLLTSAGFSNPEEQEAEAGRVLVLKARCQVMARQTRSLKKELKSVSLPGPQGQTCEFVRAHIEALHNNHRKSIKMLNSCVQAAGNRVFPHYYNNLGCLHQVMRKPNLAIYYFKNALDRLDSSQGGEGSRVPGGESSSWLTQAQVLYNIGVSLLHARRPSVAFDILVEVVGAHYLDPHVWFHLAECCLMAGQPDNSHHFSSTASQAREVAEGGAGSGPHRTIVAGSNNGPLPHNHSPASGLAAAATPSLTYDFAYMCLKNAESLLPASEQAAASGVFCEGVGYIGNPVTWAEVENLRVAVLAAKAYTALALGDYIPAGSFASDLLARESLPGGYKLLAHLYAAESLILQDKVGEALVHLDPDLVTSVEVSFPGNSEGKPGPCWTPDTLDTGKATVQFNLAVGFALREEWEKASNIVTQLYRDGQDVSVQVLLLVLYLSLRTGQVDRARRIVRERCPAGTKLLDSGQ